MGRKETECAPKESTVKVIEIISGGRVVMSNRTWWPSFVRGSLHRTTYSDEPVIIVSK